MTSEDVGLVCTRAQVTMMLALLGSRAFAQLRRHRTLEILAELQFRKLHSSAEEKSERERACIGVFRMDGHDLLLGSQIEFSVFYFAN